MIIFDPWLHRWSLTADGSPIATAYGDLLPVVRNGVRAPWRHPSRERRLELVSQAPAVDRQRTLKWVPAYAGLSAAWCMEDGDGVELRLAIVEIASRELGG